MDSQGVVAALAIATELEAHKTLCELCTVHSQIRCTVGIHPNHVAGECPDPSTLAGMAATDSVVAIGETGLDYFRGRDTASIQKDFFAAHIEAARLSGKPLVIHTRNSFDDTLDQLRGEQAQDVGGVMHCFTGTWEQARHALDFGFIISFTGIVTFRNAPELRDIVARIPSESYMIETDAPYLAPEPYRGKTNEPAHVRHIAEKCAEVRGVSLEKVAVETTANFNRLFRTSVAVP